MEKSFYEHTFSTGTFATFSDKPKIPFIGVRQVHGRDVIILKPNQNLENLEADGIVLLKADWKGESSPPIAIQTADCLPLLILGHRGVAMLHAGWRGVEKEIFFHKDVYYLAPHTLLIGPAIGSCCYQVGAEFKDHFQMVKEKEDGRYYFDLKREAISHIQKIFPHIKIVDAQMCTSCMKELQSYRRDKTEKRNYNLWIPHDS